MPPIDPRKTIGGSVRAKVLHVTSEAECARRYGANRASKWLTGVVQFVEVERTRRDRKRTLITAKYQLGGGHTKVKKLNIRSMQAETEEQTIVEGHPQQVQQNPAQGEVFQPPAMVTLTEYLAAAAVDPPPDEPDGSNLDGH